MSRSIWIAAAMVLAAFDAAPAPATPVCSAKAGAPPIWQTLPPTPLLPKPARQGFVAVDGSRIWYGEYGIDHGGMPVLLLHGGLASSAYYGQLIPDLVRAGYHVIAVDSRGHGRSAGSTIAYSYALMSRDVVAVLDALHVANADVVGWSDGGTIGYELAIAYPDRVRRLFAFGANARLEGVKPGYATTPTFASYIKRTRLEYRRAADYEGFLAAIAHMWESEPEISDTQLAKIRIPVTIAVARHDEGLKLYHADHIAASIPHGRLLILPGVSHFAMLQCPREFNVAVLDFLRSGD